MQRSYLELPRALLRAGVTLGLTLLAASELHAATVVALGASQTQGKGVSREDAFPAQLKALLKSKGIDVTVRNAGKNGDTAHHMLRRLDHLLDPDTPVVILQPGSNDARKGRGDETEANVGAMVQELRSRHIRVVMVPNRMFQNLPKGPDGQHLTVEGYSEPAHELLQGKRSTQARVIPRDC
jgi:acyl-CoA thioesterase-1